MGKLKDHFIPHEGNDYRPHSLQTAAVSGMMVLILLSFTLANIHSIIWVTSDWMVSTILPSVIVELTNEERADGELFGLRRDPVLDAAAQMKAQHMAENEYFAHYSPAGISPWHWFSEANYNFVHAGENLAIHFTDSGEVVEAWMNSPTHRANILNGDYTEIGVGAVEGTFDGYTTVYVVQLFGTPAAVASESESEEAAPAVLADSQVAAETSTTSTDTQTATDTSTTTPEENGETETQLAAETQGGPQIAGSEDVVTEEGESEVSLSTDRDPVAVTREEQATKTAANTAEDTSIDRVVTTSDSIALYSGLISTSTGGIPATIDPDTQPSGGDGAGIAGVLTQPQLLLQILYGAIALFVVSALLLAIFIEIRRQHPVQIAYSAGLMAIMGTLFYIHLAITSGAVIV